VVTLIGLGIAIDYGLFIVSRFREEIAEGYDTEAAVRRTVMTSGRTIVFSAVIIVASSLPLLLFPQGFLKSITYAIIASVMLSAILSITVLAGALAILGPNVDAFGVRTLLQVPFLRNWEFSNQIITYLAEKTQKTKTREEVEKGFWGKLVNRVMKRPIAFAAPIVIVMILLIIPLVGCPSAAAEVPPTEQLCAPGAGGVRQDLPRVPHRTTDACDRERQRPARHRPTDRRGAQQGDDGPRVHRCRQRPVQDVAGAALS
jgi:uncharacterized membrane protein YdfJ with MMPL/SSD domain